MQRSAEVVIGAGYGDEGKGLIVDALAATHGAGCMVIRFNGGAQAGHTVCLPDGRRHVFHHVGSGALAGAATFLSRFFVANPILLAEEFSALERLGVVPVVAIDPAAVVTTPFDMMINQFAETARGAARHGSCGLGIGETIERSRDPALRITVRDLADRHALGDRLAAIRSRWLPARLACLGAWPLPSEAAALVASDAVVARWCADVESFLERVGIREMSSVARDEKLVFEGAQGLLLDQDRGSFPHVTRSNTGLKNVLALAHDAAIRRLDVTYVTRAYVTRHGAGPLAHERAGPPHPDVSDATNRPNAWQGSLRFGTLDLGVLSRAIAADLGDARGIEVSHRLAVTCLDQVGARLDVVAAGRRHATAPEAVAMLAARAVGAVSLVVSRGPTRNDVDADTRGHGFRRGLSGSSKPRCSGPEAQKQMAGFRARLPHTVRRREAWEHCSPCDVHGRRP